MRFDFTKMEVRQHLHRRAWLIAFLLAAISGFLIFDLGPGYFRNTQTVLVLDLQVSSGRRLEVYVNQDFGTPLSEYLIPGQRKEYRLKGLTGDIHRIRIDPGESPGSTIDVYGVWAEDQDGAFGHIAAATIAGWGGINMTPRGLVGDAARFIATTGDPILQAAPQIKLRVNAPTFITKLVNMLSWPRSATFVVVYLGFVALVATAAFNPARLAHPFVALACVGVSVLSIYGFGTYYRALAPIDTTVGRAGFHGLSTAPATLGVLCAVLLSALVAAGFAYFLRGRTAPVRTTPTADILNDQPVPRWADRYVILAIAALLFLFYFPRIDGILQQWLTYRTAPDWDANNGLLWRYLAHGGSLPMRDFWYPYSGRYVFSLPAPAGPVLQGGYMTGVFTLTFYALYRLTGRNLPLALFAVAALAVGGSSAIYWGNDRYLQALTIALIYLAIDPRRPRIQAAHFWFWTACGFSLFFEPAQLAYAAPAVLAKILLDLALERPFDGAATLRRGIRDFLVPAMLLIVYLIFAATNGQMSNFSDFYLGLGDQSASSAQPANLALDVTKPFTVHFLIIVAPLAMLGLGLYDRLRAGPNGSHTGDALIVLGVVGVMILQKHLIRPIEWQAFVAPALGCFAYAAAYRSRNAMEFVAAGGVLGAYIAIMAMSGTLPGHWQQVIEGPNRVATFFTGDALRIAEANDKRFASFHFERFEDEVRVAKRIRALSPPGKPATSYVLTDNQVIYILLDQKPPFHSNAYNSSPVYEQEKVRQWLVRNKPKYTVLDPTKLAFDTFSTIVRVPVYFNHVIENYVPLETVGTLELLRRRRPGEPIAAVFWRDKLGSTIAFGHFPRASTAARLDRCMPGETCQNFLKISIPDTRQDRRILSVPFKAGGLDFTATFVAVSGSNFYYLSLDRIWFWDVLNRNGNTAQVDIANLPPGTTTEILRLAAGPHILY